MSTDILDPNSEFSKAGRSLRLHNRAPNFDPKCFDLAEHFLQDLDSYPAGSKGKLALLLQEAAEQFLSNLENNQ